MPKVGTEVEKSSTKRTSPPALTPEARESESISLAMDLAEQQLRDGTASSQIIMHFLKLGSMKEQLEMQILKKQGELISAKTENLYSSKKMEELYQNAMDSMKGYRYDGGGEVDDEY